MSSRIFGESYAEEMSRCKLDGMVKEKPDLLTVKLKHEMYSEFQAALEILRERSISEFIHNVVKQTIKDARKEVTKEEFESLTALKSKEIKARSLAKSRASKRSQKAGPTRSTHKRDERAA